MSIPSSSATALDTDKPRILPLVSQSITWTVYDTVWIPRSARFIGLGSYARNTGAFQIFSLKDSTKLECTRQFEKKSPFKCGTFGHSTNEERSFATGDFDGRLCIWDLEHMELPVYAAKQHDGIINAIDAIGGERGYGAPEIATAGKDGSVHVWDPRQKDEPVASLIPDEGAARRDCWTVAFGNSFNDDERCVCAGYDNGDVKLFDLRTCTLRWETNVKNGVCSVQFDRPDIEMNKMVVTTLESKFNVYDLRTFHPTKGYASRCEKGHDSTVWRASHLPHNREIFMTCGGNGSLRLHRYRYPPQRSKKGEDEVLEGVIGTVELLVDTTLSTQPICGFDWNREKEGLCCMGSFDQQVRVAFVTGLNLQS